MIGRRLRAAWYGFRHPEDMHPVEPLEVLCRVFDDVEAAWAEYRDWYDPKAWLSESRALGAFIGKRIAARPDYERGLCDGWDRGISAVEYHAHRARTTGPEHRPRPLMYGWRGVA